MNFKSFVASILCENGESGKPKDLRPYTEEDFEVTTDSMRFVVALKTANEKRGEDVLQLYIPSVSEVKDIVSGGGTLMIAKDDSAGAYVKGDGYMGGLFKDPEAKRSEAASVLQMLRRNHGGYFFDAFGINTESNKGTRLEHIYTKNGFRALLRMDFIDDLAPKNWQNSNLIHRPDNVWFVYDPSHTPTIGEGERNNNWDECYETSKAFKG